MTPVIIVALFIAFIALSIERADHGRKHTTGEASKTSSRR